ncbi:MAG: hypothetical protein ACTSVO_11390 [Candidatus Heimdallarchaeaceae archaeon]
MVLRRKNFCYILIISLFINTLWVTNNNIEITANPLSVLEQAVGGIVPGNGTVLQMIEANVIMDIDETYGENGSFAISFDGLYTIYNPNDTIEILIGAPFQTNFIDLVDTLKIEVEGLEKDFEMICFNEGNVTENTWNEYFHLPVMYNSRYFALCNVSFSGNSNTTIRYTFDSRISASSVDIIMIIYDVGTARAWNNVTTEHVEFRAYGEQPRYYYNHTSESMGNLTLTDIENGKSYLWSWESVIIEDAWVFLDYSYYIPFTGSTPGYLFLSTMVCLVAINIVFRYKKKKKG